VAAIRAAEQLVAASYLLTDLFGSGHDAREWLRGLSDGHDVRETVPEFLSDDNRALLLDRLAACHIAPNGQVDGFRVDELDRVMQLVPLVRTMEEARRPAPRPSLVCTLPKVVSPMGRRRSFGRSLAVLVADALRSSEEGGRVLIASPFWSLEGCRMLRPALQRAELLGLPVTLAGASTEPPTSGTPDYRVAMLAFAHELAADGLTVRALSYAPPTQGSLFHAKAVCGRTGYLGSGNITAAGMERHVEVGVPLAEVDVAEVWWMLEQLEGAALLRIEIL
jgi:hypothetical protein